MKIKIKFRLEDIELDFFNYSDGNIGIMMNHIDTGQSWGNVTVNVENLRLPHNEVLIKNWHSNKGIYEALLEQEIIMSKRRDCLVGINKAIVCSLHPVILAKLNDSKKTSTFL